MGKRSSIWVAALLSAFLIAFTTTSMSTEIINFFGHNSGLAGNTARTDYNTAIIDNALENNKTVIVVLHPHQAGCSYTLCAKGENQLNKYLSDIDSLGYSPDMRAGIAEIITSYQASLRNIRLQAGNEILSPLYRADWEKYFGPLTDEKFIELYREYYLAPLAEAVYIANGRVSPGIMMVGSFGNAGNQYNRDKMLGLYASSFSGSKATNVAEQPISSHYGCMSGHYLLSTDEDYLSSMNKIFSVGNCYWATEEIGRQVSTGGDAYTLMLSVISRTINIASSMRLQPYQFRVLAWEVGDGAATAINELPQ